jgi:predicted ribosome quality control (RQC) complex YloA/Tae2 family protein
MNRLYLIFPIILLGLFGGIYWQHSQVAATEAATRASEMERLKNEELARKATAERTAREESTRRAATREAEELKKEEEKRIRWEADEQRIKEETAQFSKRGAELMSEIERVEKELAGVRVTKDRVDRENFEIAREVELARIAKRNAELEIQRAVEVVAQRAAHSISGQK